jgi:hypothetical protein
MTGYRAPGKRARGQVTGPNAGGGLVCLGAWLVAFWSLIAAQVGSVWATAGGLAAAGGALLAMRYLARPYAAGHGQNRMTYRP